MSQDLDRCRHIILRNIPCEAMPSTHFCTQNIIITSHMIIIMFVQKIIQSNDLTNSVSIIFHWCFICPFHHRNHWHGMAWAPRWPCRSSPGPRPPRPRSVAAWSPRGHCLCTSRCTSRVKQTPKVQQISNVHIIYFL